MPIYTTNAPQTFLPFEVGQLLIEPIIQQSRATLVGNVIRTTAAQFRIPVVATDAAAGWTAEGAEIAPSDAVLAEAVVNFGKLAGLSIVSNEMLADAVPQIAQVIGDGLARDISMKLDVAFFGTKGASTVQPAGLRDLPTTGAGSVTTISAGGAWANIDAFTSAVYAAANVGAQLGGFVANPTDALLLAQIKQLAGGSVPLLQPDPTSSGAVTVAGVPLLTSPAVQVGTIWGVPAGRAYVVIREDATVTVDSSAFFSSDRSAVRAVLRVGFAFPHPASIVRVTKA